MRTERETPGRRGKFPKKGNMESDGAAGDEIQRKGVKVQRRERQMAFVLDTQPAGGGDRPRIVASVGGDGRA